MSDDIDAIRRERKVGNARMFASKIPAFRQLEELEGEVLRDGALPQKYKELIALGVSIAESCDG